MPMSRAMRALARRLPVCIPSVEHNRVSAGLLPSPPGKPLPASNPPCSSCGLAPAALACWWSVFLVVLCAVTLSPPPIQHSGCIPYSSLHCMQNGHGPSSPMAAPSLLPTLLRISPFVIRRSKFRDGTAPSHAPACGARTAINRALSTCPA